MVCVALQRAMHACTVDPKLVLHCCEGMIACLGLARAEVLWYFLHVNEVGCRAVLVQ